MLLFVKIVGGVLLALLLAGVFGWWFVKRWLKRKFGDYAASAALIDERYHAPARLHLQLTEAEELSPEFEARWQQAYELGFRRLADLHARDGEPGMLRAAVHDAQPIALALGQYDEAVHFALFALADDQRLSALSDGPGQSLQEGTLDWQVVPALDLADAQSKLTALCAERSLRSIDLSLFRQVFERAYARRQDAMLALPPVRAELEKRALADGAKPTPNQVDAAWALQRGVWQGRLSEAVLDHYRVVSRIGAEQWERIGEDLHVVHAHLSNEDIRDLLVDETAEQTLWQQLVAQGLRGAALYEALSQRLPASRRRQLLMEVRRPVAAKIYAPADAPSTAPAAKPHYYRATAEGGREVHGAVLARTSGEAKQQLAANGLDDAQITLEPNPLSSTPEFMLDPEFAAIASRSVKEGLGMAMLRSLQGNLWLWAPPLLWVSWILYRGAPYGWGDYVGFVYLALALVVLFVFIAPMVLYNQLQHCRVHARWRSGQLCLALLRRFNLLGGMSRDQLDLEQAKLLAGEGKFDAALKLWQARAATRDEVQQQTGLVQLHDAAGRTDDAIACQRRVLELQPSDLAQIDLAMSLARHGHPLDEVEHLIASVDPRELSELALTGYQFARGLIAHRREQSAQALHHFSEAIEQASQFKSSPLILGILAEINGYSALALKRSGEQAKADSVWKQVRPILIKHASASSLVEQYEGLLA